MKSEDSELFKLPLTILENERVRIAHEFHDTIIQNLVHTIYQSELTLHYIDEDPVRAKLELAALSKNIKKTIADARNILYELRPMAITDLGFKETMEEYINYLKSLSTVKFTCEMEDGLDCLGDSERLVVYRVIQEACNNILKHSRASRAFIHIKKYKEKFYKISIDDDGVGCNKEELSKIHHYGLKIMEERVKMISGNIEIHSDLDQGFHITVIIPAICKEEADL